MTSQGTSTSSIFFVTYSQMLFLPKISIRNMHKVAKGLEPALKPTLKNNILAREIHRYEVSKPTPNTKIQPPDFSKMTLNQKKIAQEIWSKNQEFNKGPQSHFNILKITCPKNKQECSNPSITCLKKDDCESLVERLGHLSSTFKHEKGIELNIEKNINSNLVPSKSNYSASALRTQKLHKEYTKAVNHPKNVEKLDKLTPEKNHDEKH